MKCHASSSNPSPVRPVKIQRILFGIQRSRSLVRALTPDSDPCIIQTKSAQRLLGSRLMVSKSTLMSLFASYYYDIQACPRPQQAAVWLSTTTTISHTRPSLYCTTDVTAGLPISPLDSMAPQKMRSTPGLLMNVNPIVRPQPPSPEPRWIS